MRRTIPVVALLLAIAAAVYFFPRARQPSGRPASSPVASADPTRAPAEPSPSSPESATSAPAIRAGSTANASPGSAAPYNESDFPIAASLNAPGSAIAQDLDIVRQLFEAWQSNFPREGNPVGENAEITSALMGDNRLGLVLIPKGHRAVNERGELCDRWGTPFRFHQLSGSHMEIRSAGPDRKFATEDDARWTPQ